MPDLRILLRITMTIIISICSRLASFSNSIVIVHKNDLVCNAVFYMEFRGISNLHQTRSKLFLFKRNPRNTVNNREFY